MQTISARMEGRVQGVFFRDSTRTKAQQLGLHGWVKNTADGAVEAEFQGTHENIAEMKEWLHEGPPHSIVTKVSCREIDTQHTYSDFQIRW